MMEQPAASAAAILRTACVTGKIPRRESSNRANGLHNHHVAHAVGAGGNDAAIGTLPFAGIPVENVARR